MPGRPGLALARLRKALLLHGMTVNQFLVLTVLFSLGTGCGAWTLQHDVIAALSISLLMESFVAILLCFWMSSRGGRTKRLGPPLNAEFLFYLFLSRQNCDALVGDLEERYTLIHRKFGRWRANVWYWFQTFNSLRPIIWAAMKRVSGLMALIEAYRRMRG